jgi:cobalt/nickel transport system permease protein
MAHAVRSDAHQNEHGPAEKATAAAPLEDTTMAAQASSAPAPESAEPARKRVSRNTKGLWITGLLAALLLAGGLSYYASASPDGLEKVAADHGIDRKAEDHAAKNSPLADYRTEDVDNARLSGGLAGVIGVGGTLAVGTGVFWVIRRRPSPDED